MDNSSLMNRENKKRQLRRQIVPPRYQTEEESEQAIRNAHKKTVRKRLAVLAVVAVLLGGAAFGIYYYDRYTGIFLKCHIFLRFSLKKCHCFISRHEKNRFLLFHLIINLWKPDDFFP